MKKAITNYRTRTNVTQEHIAIDLGTNKPNICLIEQGKRNGSRALYENAFKNASDPYFLNDLVFELSSGYGTPTPTNDMYCDHRLSIKHRCKREIQEFMQALKDHSLDKRPDQLDESEKERIKLLASEVLDNIFEFNALFMKLNDDYSFINLKKLVQSRNVRYQIERR